MSSRWTWQKREWTRGNCITDCAAGKNPVRGFYHVYTYDLAEKEAEEDWVWSLQKDERLALVLLDIGKCARRAISQEEVSKAGRIFSLFRDHGMQMIVRVVYDREGRGMEREPERIGLVLLHMRQLGPVMTAFSAHIITVQGLFVGSWGEMHDSKFLEKEPLCLLYDTLREATGGSVRISVRKPQQQRLLRGAGGSIRTGLYDDAILGSETDMGTFGWIDDVGNPDIMWTPKRELAFMQLHTARMPCGGEVLAGALSFSAGEVLERMRLMHLTYLNSVHEPAVWEQWKRTACGGMCGTAGACGTAGSSGTDGASGAAGACGIAGMCETSAACGDVSLYDYIRAHLGYRYVLEDISPVEGVSGTRGGNICGASGIRDGGICGVSGTRGGEICGASGICDGNICGSGRCGEGSRLMVTVKNTGFACCHDDLRMELLIGDRKLSVSFPGPQLAAGGTICVVFDIKEALLRAQAVWGGNQTVLLETVKTQTFPGPQQGSGAALLVRLALYHEKTNLPVYFANDFLASADWDKCDRYCRSSSLREGVPVGVLSMEKDAVS